MNVNANANELQSAHTIRQQFDAIPSPSQNEEQMRSKVHKQFDSTSMQIRPLSK